MNNRLRKLFDEILKEVERRPEFAKRVESALGDSDHADVREPLARPRRNRRAPGPFDPFSVFSEGEEIFNERLAALSVDELKNIVSEHSMDSSRLALKWRSKDRLVELIVSTVRSRMAKGDAFKRPKPGDER